MSRQNLDNQYRRGQITFGHATPFEAGRVHKEAAGNWLVTLGLLAGATVLTGTLVIGACTADSEEPAPIPVPVSAEPRVAPPEHAGDVILPIEPDPQGLLDHGASNERTATI